MKFYSTDEVATILKIDNETVRRYAQQKRIKAYKFGKKWRIKEEDLKSFIEDQFNR